eukprot:TRINITY_DN261_c0_g3_i1.p1 TRINITY_DN261_c0_g3~~TRINITY_DN261_c0_g3_i1.p1  ORF type:complete len:321 (+),score=35.63 TRINITY_DN261_c0_g3_i1:94-1056(+)
MCEEEDDCGCCGMECNWLCVGLVVLLISYCYASYYYLIVWEYNWLHHTHGIINVILLNIGFSLLCYCYYKAISIHPGKVGPHYVPNFTREELEKAKNKEKRRSRIKYIPEFYRPRWCPYCKNFKPPRSHHCRDCDACVLKMDHHCPWINNCVGFRNHKYFVLFLFYASVCLTYFLILCCGRFYYAVRMSGRNRGKLLISPGDVLMIISHLVLTLPVTLGIISLLFYQLSCMKENLTSIETYIKKQYKRGAKKAGLKKWIWFYDHGAINNYRKTLGPSIKFWLLPIPYEMGNGLEYKTRFYDVENSSSTSSSSEEHPKKRY